MRILFIAIIVIILGVAGFFVYTNLLPTTPITMPSVEQGATPATQVQIKNLAFNPNEITVKPGEAITVTNSDIVDHTLTSDQEGLFDTGLLGRGESKTFTAPMAPGRYTFHCTPHPYMKGALVVAK